MGCIKVTNYLDITTYYGNSQAQLAGISDYFYLAAYEIVTLQTFDPELDLLQPFYTAYLTSQYAYSIAPASILAAVRALQQHILNRARSDEATPRQFADIDGWIQATISGVSVGRQNDVSTDIASSIPSSFKTMSAQAGFPISV